jgi:hypothetical protein
VGGVVVTARKKKPVILGPDGRPYVAPPKKAEPVVGFDAASGKDSTVIATADGTVISDEVHSWTFDLSGHLQRSLYGSLFAGPRPKLEAKRSLADAVGADVDALTADFDGTGGAELPKPPPDLHTYADAYLSAVKNCRHPNPESTLYSQGEFFCPDCQRYFGPEEYKRTRTGFGWFG